MMESESTNLVPPANLKFMMEHVPNSNSEHVPYNTSECICTDHVWW